MTIKGYERTFWSGGKVVCLDHDSNMGAQIFQNNALVKGGKNK